MKYLDYNKTQIDDLVEQLEWKNKDLMRYSQRLAEDLKAGENVTTDINFINQTQASITELGYKLGALQQARSEMISAKKANSLE